jgi:hypothetical protein
MLWLWVIGALGNGVTIAFNMEEKTITIVFKGDIHALAIMNELSGRTITMYMW